MVRLGKIFYEATSGRLTSIINFCIVSQAYLKPGWFGQVLGKIGQKPGFFTKSKETVPKTEVLE
jgi:hypothetical protein